MCEKLVANVCFTDVDGKSLQIKYSHGYDVCYLLEYLADFITDEHNFSKVKNQSHSGINGIIDITKPINIIIQPE